MKERQNPLSFELGNFTLAGMLRCGRGIRRAAEPAESMDAAADAIVRYLYSESGTAPGGERACALVRCYRTLSYDRLEAAQRRFADTLLGATAGWAEMKCLTLIATVGDEEAWCSPTTSRGHRAVPLPSPEIVEQAPMIAQLIRQMGLQIADVVSPNPAVVPDLEGKSYNVFHVDEALDSPYIPAQADFVVPYRIKSVVGFGGLLRSGDLFAIIMFSRVPLSEEAASRFRTIALDVKAALFRFET